MNLLYDHNRIDDSLTYTINILPYLWRYRPLARDLKQKTLRTVTNTPSPTSNKRSSLS